MMNKEFLVVVMVLVGTVRGGLQYGQPSYSTGPQKFVRDSYGYRPVGGSAGRPPFGRPFQQGGVHPGGGRPSHAASSLIHGQQGFPPHQGGVGQFPSHQQGNFQGHQGQFPSNQGLGQFQQGHLPSHQGQGQFQQGHLPSHQGQGQFQQGHLPSHQGQGQFPSHGNQGVGGSDFDLAQFARVGPTAGKKKKN